MICQSCPRPGEIHEASVPPGSGGQLADRVAADLRERGACIPVLRVDCLSRCRRPCNVRLAGRGKQAVELTLLRPEHAADLAQFAMSYSASETGRPPEDETPASLRGQMVI